MTDQPSDQRIFARPLTLPVASDETDASTWSLPPRQKSVPRKIASLIGKLGLRYEPSAKADLDAHAARVALLAEDMAEADPWKLEQAISHHVASSPYLPKASDLNAIMADMSRPAGASECVDVVGIRNAHLAATGSNLRWEWNNPNDRRAGTHLTSLAPLENRLADLP